jgi:hypothetical protein
MTAPAFAEASAGAREEAMAPAAAATRNNEQKIRRHTYGLNAGACFAFVVMELPVVCFCIWDRIVAPKFSEGG